MINYNNLPINKMLWTDKVQEIADVRLFYYHLLLDLGISPVENNLIHKLTMDDNKPLFTPRGASNYDKLLKDCFKISGVAEFVLDRIWSELNKWNSDNNESIKRVPVISNSSGKVLYKAGFKSGFPAMSTLYSFESINGKTQYKKVGYGTIKYIIDSQKEEHFYKIYDNVLNKYFDGILNKLNNGNFEIRIDSNND